MARRQDNHHDTHGGWASYGAEGQDKNEESDWSNFLDK